MNKAQSGPAVQALRDVQRRLVAHGGFVILLGGIFGFGFLFYLLGRVELWPIPGRIDYQFPGTEKAWRMAHLEGVLNGILLWLVAALLPVLALPLQKASRVATALIITAWTLPLASIFDALFEKSRGLHFGPPLTNFIPFFLFYVGILTSLWAIWTIATSALRSSDQAAPD